MEQILNITSPAGKIYKDKIIYISTFLGGPLVAGYLIAENFKVFGDSVKVKQTWIYTIIFTVVLFGGLFLIPDIDKVPRQIIPIAYTAVAFYLVQHFQGTKITEHINAGGQVYKWWRTIIISLIGLVITSLSIFGIAYLSDSISSPSLTTKSYGIMKHEIDFDKNNISEQEVDKIADGLRQTTFFDETITKYIYAKKVNSNYELSISCNNSIISNPEALQPFIQLHSNMQTLFPDHKIIFNLVVDNLDNVVKRLE
jgi:hypothetical protein